MFIKLLGYYCHNSIGDIMINYKLIGQRIRKARLRNSLTQETLAEKIKVSTEYFSKIECGKVKVNLQRLAQISNILDEKTEYLIAGTVLESSDYLREEFLSVLKTLPSGRADAILKIAKIVSEIK